MIPVRKKIELRRGVDVEMLFTPRLYAFKGTSGVTFSADTNDLMQVYALYADIMYCAALNFWTLNGKDAEVAPFSRADFHEFSASNPQEFGKAVDFALKALSGKSLKDFIPSQEKASEKGGKPVKKKSFARWITRLLKPSSLADAE